MTAATTIRVLLVDDHALVRTGLRILLESQPSMVVIGEADDGPAAVAQTASERPDVILLDLDLNGRNGGDLIPSLLSAYPAARILILTGLRDAEVHRRAVQLGAVGLVQKDMAAEVLVKAIEKVFSGEVWLDRSLTATVLTDLSHAGRARQADPEQARIASLSRRESEVISLIAEGLSNKLIAGRMAITETTVRHHLTSIFSKLGVSDRLELLVYAYRNKMVRPLA
jgi:two-component system, NarL family, nitrate/nitrite response regulator NarL